MEIKLFDLHNYKIKYWGPKTSDRIGQVVVKGYHPYSMLKITTILDISNVNSWTVSHLSSTIIILEFSRTSLHRVTVPCSYGREKMEAPA